jgi:hypothetical protein
MIKRVRQSKHTVGVRADRLINRWRNETEEA